MNKYFFIAMSLVLVLVTALIGYGIYVNYAGESVILERMNHREIVVSTAAVQKREIKAQYEFAEATFEAENSVDVIAKVNGVISNRILHKNKQIQAGDVIAVLTNEEVPLRIKQAESALKKAQAVELQCRNSYHRYASLIEQNATSMEKLDEARANYEAAQASTADAQAQYDQAVLNQSRLNVVSDVSGSVLVIYKEQGSYVTAGTPICLIGDFQEMWFALNIDDATLRSLLGDGDDAAKFTLSFKRPDFVKSYATEYGSGNRGDKSEFPVDIRGIYPDLSQPADMRRVVFGVHNDAGILEARSYEHLVLTNKAPQSVLSVPLTALTNNNDMGTVLVVNQDNELEERHVQLGGIGSEYAEILSGVYEGEMVVTSGTEGLKPGQKVVANMEGR